MEAIIKISNNRGQMGASNIVEKIFKSIFKNVDIMWHVSFIQYCVRLELYMNAIQLSSYNCWVSRLCLCLNSTIDSKLLHIIIIHIFHDFHHYYSWEIAKIVFRIKWLSL